MQLRKLNEENKGIGQSKMTEPNKQNCLIPLINKKKWEYGH
jgi:hypothetical protein